MILSRRSALIGMLSALAAPAIVRATSIMPVKKLILPPVLDLSGAMPTIHVAFDGSDELGFGTAEAPYRTYARALKASPRCLIKVAHTTFFEGMNNRREWTSISYHDIGHDRIREDHQAARKTLQEIQDLRWRQDKGQVA
jgi:hypothetical protein